MRLSLEKGFLVYLRILISFNWGKYICVFTFGSDSDNLSNRERFTVISIDQDAVSCPTEASTCSYSARVRKLARIL